MSWEISENLWPFWMCVTEVRTVRIGYQKRRAIIYVDTRIISTRVNAAISKKYHLNGWNKILNNQINGQFHARQWNFAQWNLTNRKLKQWAVWNYWDLVRLVHVLNVRRHEIQRIWISLYLEFLDGNFKQSFNI